MSGHAIQQPSESVIRRMTRLAIKHNAVNLSQGFPNASPEFDPVFRLICGVLGGTDDRVQEIAGMNMKQIANKLSKDSDVLSFEDVIKILFQPGRVDQLNQYSMPFGRPELRRKVADYYRHWYDWEISPDAHITIGLGATEPYASTLRALCDVGDTILIFEPYHELYPNQAALFYIRSKFCTLHEDVDKEEWEIDWAEFEIQLTGCRALVLNSPHNPTGKVFTQSELERICDACVRHDVVVITDEIYEHIIFDPDYPHICVPKLPGMAERTVVVNSVSKSLSATGWRVGWAVSPSWLTPKLRAVHDQMALQAPTPQQFATERFLGLPDEYFREELPRKYQERRDVLMPALQDLGFWISCPRGAYYLFANYRGIDKYAGMNPMDLATYLVEKVGLAVVPGDNFYSSSSDGDNYIRFAFCRSMEDICAAIEVLRKDLKESSTLRPAVPKEAS